MDACLRNELIKISITLCAVSAALTYWITHDHHTIRREIAAAPTQPASPVLEKDVLMYCPICGEPIRLAPSPLSIGAYNPTYRYPVELRRYRDSVLPEFNHEE